MPQPKARIILELTELERLDENRTAGSIHCEITGDLVEQIRLLSIAMSQSEFGALVKLAQEFNKYMEDKGEKLATQITRIDLSELKRKKKAAES